MTVSSLMLVDCRACIQAFKSVSRFRPDVASTLLPSPTYEIRNE